MKKIEHDCEKQRSTKYVTRLYFNEKGKKVEIHIFDVTKNITDDKIEENYYNYDTYEDVLFVNFILFKKAYSLYCSEHTKEEIITFLIETIKEINHFLILPGKDFEYIGFDSEIFNYIQKGPNVQNLNLFYVKHILPFLEEELKAFEMKCKFFPLLKEKEEQVGTAFHSEKHTDLEDWIKFENGKVLWLESQDELSRTLFVMCKDEEIKKIIGKLENKFKYVCLYKALKKIDLKLYTKGIKVNEIKEKSFLASYSRAKKEFEDSTRKNGEHYKKEDYKPAADKLSELIKSRI